MNNTGIRYSALSRLRKRDHQQCLHGCKFCWNFIISEEKCPIIGETTIKSLNFHAYRILERSMLSFANKNQVKQELEVDEQNENRPFSSDTVIDFIQQRERALAWTLQLKSVYSCFQFGNLIYLCILTLCLEIRNWVAKYLTIDFPLYWCIFPKLASPGSLPTPIKKPCIAMECLYFDVDCFQMVERCPGGSVASASDSWTGGCEFVQSPVEATFLSGVFSPLTSAEACEKSSWWLWKEKFC